MKHSPREHQRVYLTFYLRVFEGREFLGFLIDLSKDGIMIMTDKPLDKEKFYDLKMKVPSSLEWKGKSDPDRCIKFTAQCRWTKKDDVDKDFYLNGFEFTDLGSDDDQMIHRILEEYKIR